MSTTIPDATLATMTKWAGISKDADQRNKGARFGVILATYDEATNSIATAAEIKSTKLLPKSTAERYTQWAAVVAQALGFAPEPNAANADRLYTFVSLASAAANVPAAHRAGILARLGEHADSLADLVKRAEALLVEAKDARESQARGARPEGNAPHSEAEEPAEAADEPAGPRPLSSILGELAAHLNALPAEDLADALDEVSALVDQASARIFA